MSSSSAESSDEEVETLVEDPSMTGPVKPRSESGDSGPSNHGSRKSEGAVAAADYCRRKSLHAASPGPAQATVSTPARAAAAIRRRSISCAQGTSGALDGVVRRASINYRGPTDGGRNPAHRFRDGMLYGAERTPHGRPTPSHRAPPIIAHPTTDGTPRESATGSAHLVQVEEIAASLLQALNEGAVAGSSLTVGELRARLLPQVMRLSDLASSAVSSEGSSVSRVPHRMPSSASSSASLPVSASAEAVGQASVGRPHGIGVVSPV